MYVWPVGFGGERWTPSTQKHIFRAGPLCDRLRERKPSLPSGSSVPSAEPLQQGPGWAPRSGGGAGTRAGGTGVRGGAGLFGGSKCGAGSAHCPRMRAREALLCLFTGPVSYYLLPTGVKTVILTLGWLSFPETKRYLISQAFTEHLTVTGVHECNYDLGF